MPPHSDKYHLDGASGFPTIHEITQLRSQMNPGAIEVALSRFNGLMWAISHKFGKGLSGIDAADLVQECSIKLVDLLESHGDLPESEFSSLLSRSCINLIHSIRRKQRPTEFNVVDLDDVSYLLGESGFQDLFLSHYQEHIGSLVCPDAVRLLRELLDPSEETEVTLFKRNLRRAHVHLPVSNRITHQLAGQVLGFHPSKTKKLIQQLQQACVEHLGIRPWTYRQLPTVA
jgi:DNA-directed RNA polymerase specialized sigma24 family protein